jgi:hypothetical protein
LSNPLRRFRPAVVIAIVTVVTLPPLVHAAPAGEVRTRLLSSLRERREAVSAMRGRAQLVVSAPEWDGSSQAEAAVVARRPDAIRLRAWVGPSTLFDVIGVGDTCGAHLVRYGAWARGPCAGLASFSGLPAQPADVVEALFGEPFLDQDSLVVDEQEADAVLASWPAPGGGRIHGRFRRAGFVPTSYEWREGERVRARLRYDDFLQESFGPWPRTVQVEWPERRALLRLRFHELDLDPELDESLFALAPPEGATVIEWGEALERASEIAR